MDISADDCNKLSKGHLPGLLDLKIISIEKDLVVAEMPITNQHMAPNGYVHAGAIVSFADTCCGYGCLTNLAEGTGFTTIELKSNHLSTAQHGVMTCQARPIHVGGSTHVWDAVIKHKETDKTLAFFRCTQMILKSKR